MAVSRRGLSGADRAPVEVRPRGGLAVRSVARALDRSAGTVSDEIDRMAAGRAARRRRR